MSPWAGAEPSLIRSYTWVSPYQDRASAGAVSWSVSDLYAAGQYQRIKAADAIVLPGAAPAFVRLRLPYPRRFASGVAAERCRPLRRLSPWAICRDDIRDDIIDQIAQLTADAIWADLEQEQAPWPPGAWPSTIKSPAGVEASADYTIEAPQKESRSPWPEC